MGVDGSARARSRVCERQDAATLQFHNVVLPVPVVRRHSVGPFAPTTTLHTAGSQHPSALVCQQQKPREHQPAFVVAFDLGLRTRSTGDLNVVGVELGRANLVD